MANNNSLDEFVKRLRARYKAKDDPAEEMVALKAALRRADNRIHDLSSDLREMENRREKLIFKINALIDRFGLNEPKLFV